jgi:hypothetical protein
MDYAPTINEQALREQHGADWEDALACNVKAIRSLHKKAPTTVHETRTTAQYPELNVAAYSWKSSAEVTMAMARNILRQGSENFYLLQTFCLKKIVGLRELSQKLGTEDATFEYLEPYARLGMVERQSKPVSRAPAS